MEIGYSHQEDSGDAPCSESCLIRNNAYVSHKALSPLHKPAAYLSNSQHMLIEIRIHIQTLAWRKGYFLI